ncbi:hypothetical protein AOQ84DRAFT_369737 [Glonium stellatum]|uniref:Uncharacterized protein n=1 Tax=Glonium stellatum TaxID=574774 RepID=A0A8E2JLW2_9PEZI|nr:hypothetical protein AOQ84DRAFT_369737 [Glonium stellatum]
MPQGTQGTQRTTIACRSRKRGHRYARAVTDVERVPEAACLPSLARGAIMAPLGRINSPAITVRQLSSTGAGAPLLPPVTTAYPPPRLPSPPSSPSQPPRPSIRRSHPHQAATRWDRIWRIARAAIKGVAISIWTLHIAQRRVDEHAASFDCGAPVLGLPRGPEARGHGWDQYWNGERGEWGEWDAVRVMSTKTPFPEMAHGVLHDHDDTGVECTILENPDNLATGRQAGRPPAQQKKGPNCIRSADRVLHVHTCAAHANISQTERRRAISLRAAKSFTLEP